MKFKTFFAAAIFITATLFIFDACKKDTSENDLVQTSEDNADVQDLFDDLSIQASLYELGNKTMCPTVIVTHPDSTFFPKHVVIDFGTEGCEGPHGRMRAGKIIIDQSGPFFVEGSIRIFSLDSFYVDDFHVEGIREVTCDGRNDDDFIQHSIEVIGGKVTTPEGQEITRDASRTRVWFDGEDTPFNIYDDKYSITGTASGINRFGYNYQSEITEPIIVDLSCIYRLVQGIVTITSDEHLVTIDYGDGTCDNIAIVTIDGEEKEIHFRRKR